MSTHEKLAWAKKNGVTPPDYVLAAAEAETQQAETRSCCDHAAEKPTSCCSANQAPAARTCCTATAERKCSTPRSPGNVDWVLGIHAQKCQGISTLWIVSGAVLPPPPPLKAPVDSAPPLWWSDSPVCIWQTVSRLPDVPPPQQG